MKHDELVGWGGTAFGAVMTALQAEPVLHIIQAILTIIGLLITIAYTLWKWYRKASEDGKITVEEIDELFDEVNDKINNKEESKKNDKI
ncbi:MAG: hypothetical protein IKF82_07440 [Bacilli bacterium]|nr:hypothetical protein [Bacilli bacterium]